MRRRLLSAAALSAVIAACGPGSSGTQRITLAPVELVGEPSRPLPQVEPVVAEARELAAVAGCTTWSQGLRVLVLSADGNEVDLPAIRQALDYHSIPYTVWIASQRPGQLTPAQLSSGCSGAYQGVILTVAGLPYSPDGGGTWGSALTASEWQALRSYESAFEVREIAWYAYPGADQGLTTVGSTGSPVTATWTTAGAALFPYLVPATPVAISDAWTYLADVADPATVTVLLRDAAGHALASVRRFADGREALTLTFDSNPYLRHAVLLSHGLVEWVTKGVYLGEFRAYLTPQIDDLLIEDDLYTGGVYRMTATDMNQAATWLAAKQGGAGNAGLRLAWALNGEGGSTTDPLTLAARRNASRFVFINHTFSHENLDATSYSTTYSELSQNRTFCTRVGLTCPVTTLVTPDVSGLNNANAMRAMATFGVRWMVSDTSQPGWDNPVPNVGIQSTLQPNIYVIPRRPTNLFYNVSRPAEWTSEYNAFYRSYWGRDLTYTEILDRESDVLLQYMLRGEIDPHMYHQSNLRRYDSSHSLLSDLLDRAIQKFRSYSTLPLQSPDLATSGARMKATGTRNAAALTAYRTPGVGVTLSSPVALQVALSGVCRTGSELYAGKCITSVALAPNVPVTLPAP